MLTTQELNDIDLAMADVYNLVAKYQQQSTNQTGWTDIVGLTSVPCMIIPTNSVERARGQDFYSHPVDATGRCAESDLIKVGLRMVVTTIQGQAASGQDAVTYLVLARDPLLSMGRQLELKLWRQG